MTGARPDLEAEYDNRGRVPDSGRIIAGWAAQAASFRDEAGRRLTRLAYGETPRQVVDLVAPADDRQPGVAVLFVHGGYWQALGPDQFSHLARGLDARGVRVGIVGYDLCPAVGIGDIVEEVRAACAAVARAGARRLVVAGHSAGGHLAACLLATDWRARGLDPDLVPAAYAVSGLFELAPLMGTSVNGALRLDAAEAERWSPLSWPPPRGRSLDAVVGADESGEYLRQSRSITAVWGAAGVATRFEALPGANHFTVVAPLADPASAMTARLAALAGAAGHT